MSTSEQEKSGVQSRRNFLKLSALAGGGLVLGFYLKGQRAGAQEIGQVTASNAAEFSPNAWIRLATDGSIRLIAHQPEMGQGIRTSLPMIIAEEMDADWAKVGIEAGLFDGQKYGSQSAGGSRSTPSNYENMRRLGAAARAMLVEAAATTWGVPAAECSTEKGVVSHSGSKRSAGYGELVTKAATLPVPAANTIPLKDPKNFKLLGTRVGGYENEKLVTGQPVFGIDQKIPGMVNAVYVKCPVFGSKAISANLDEVKALPGVKDAFILEGTASLTGLMPGVAILADTTWAAFSARKKLVVKWEENKYANDSWAEFTRKANEIGAKMEGGESIAGDGDADAAFGGAAKVIEATYIHPFISHATLEPQNTTAHVQGDRVEVWTPTQNPSSGARLISSVLGIPEANIKMTITRSGGGFGRRLSGDYVVEAAAISQKAGLPVKLTWTREDDMQHDHFRTGGFHFLKGAVDAAGKLIGWQNHFVTFGVKGGGGNRGGGGNDPDRLSTGSGGSLDGSIFPRRFVPNFKVMQSVMECNIPMGPLRAPGSNTFAYVMQGFVDELAHAAGKDPLQFQLDLLANPIEMPAQGGGGQGARGGGFSAARAAGVLKLAAEKAGWGRKFERGQGAGIAFYYSHQGYVAYVAEVSVSRDGVLKVDRVVAAADVGRQIVNLSGAENQVEGSIIDGLSAAMYQELNIEGGAIVQSNFADYSLLRMPMSPTKIECHFLKSDNNPTGLGEPPFPPVAPALANAIFAACGKRLREFPWSKTDLSWT